MLLKRYRLFVFLVLLSALVLTSCSKANSTAEPSSGQPTNKAEPAPGQPLKKTEFLLGTTVDIILYDKQDEAIIDKAMERIKEIQNRMTINNADTSEIIALNEAAGKDWVKLSPETFEVIERAMYYAKLTNGIFDPTIGPIVKLWNINTDYAAVPDPKILEEKRQLINFNKLKLDRSKLLAKLEDPGMKVDLGAVAKGHTADEVAKILRENGVKHAIINLGGNVLTIGGNMQDKPWRIGVQDPFNPRGEFLGIVTVKDQTVVTSGTYERYFIQDGKRYHHILDPRTGYPADNEVASVSIITDKSMEADGNSTSALLLGVEEGMKFIEKQGGLEAIFVTYDKKVYVTPGIKSIFTITNPEFKLMN